MSLRTVIADEAMGILAPRNYIRNGIALKNTSGWATYADAAGAAPVDGTGGSPNVTFSRFVSAYLSGISCFTLVKDAANRQGQGVSYDFTVDQADLAKILTISFDAKLSNGTYSNSTPDLTVWIYDYGNNVLIQPSNYKLDAVVTDSSQKFSAQFQTNVNSALYRLIIHVSSTSASAYTVAFDNFVVSPKRLDAASVVIDYGEYVPTLSGVGTATSVDIRAQRCGSYLYVQGRFTTGTVAASEARISLPAGLVNSSEYIGSTVVGSCWRDNASGSTPKNRSIIATSSLSYITIGHSEYTTASAPSTSANGDVLFSNAEVVHVAFSVKIQGWGANTSVLGAETARTVAARISGDPASASSGNPVIFPTVAYDTHGAYNNSTGRYTVQVPGLYRVHGSITSANASIVMSVFVNAASVVVAGYLDANGEGSYTATVQVNAGDIIDLRPNGTLDAASGSTLHIERISGPEAIGAGEIVAAQYGINSAQSITTATDTALTSLGTKYFDTHGMINGATGAVTIPVAGLYAVTYHILWAAAAWTAIGNEAYGLIYKNGSTFMRVGQNNLQTTTSVNITCSGTVLLSLTASDTLSLRVAQNSGSNKSLQASDTISYISIRKVN